MIISKRKKVYRYILVAFFVLDIFFIGIIDWNRIQSSIPDRIWTYVGREERLTANPMIQYSKKEEKTVEALHINQKNQQTVVMLEGEGTYEVCAKLFGIFPIKEIQVRAMEPIQVAASGEPIGIYVETKGLLVLSTTSVEGQDGLIHEPATNIVKTGDYILQVEGTPVKTIQEFNQSVQKRKGEKIHLQIRRERQKLEVAISSVPAKDGTNKLGIWVREDTQGIGTMTYVTKEGKFGALGHGITDADTGMLMDLRGGELYKTKILDIIKGEKGLPGELEGYINMVAEECVGEIEKNTTLGIFGKLSEPSMKTKQYFEVGLRQDIKPGKAWIYSQIEGTAKKYEIQIEKVNATSTDNKGMIIRVTDKHLLFLTGGIVQGMSGSPIIQNDKIIGAVTHVFVDDPTKGYGIFIENMLEH